MTVFSYRAINDDNTEVRGQVDAQDLDGANHALEDLHLDVIEVHEASRMHGGTATALSSAVASPPALVSTPSSSYHPLLLTLRLYGGWLLAWYGLFVAVGYYSTVRQIPLDIPFVQAFFVSPLIFSFIVAIFLFLMLGAIHRAMHGKIVSGMMLSVMGIIGFMAVRWSL